jgi:hypothetical protein
MSDNSTWIGDDVNAAGRIAAGLAGIGLIVLMAFGWLPPDWLTAGIAGILFYCMIMISIAQFFEFLWRRIRSK